MKLITMSETYQLSFTFGGLLYPETAIIARRYREFPDWDALKMEASKGALLRKARESSRNRYFREIKARLCQAWPFEIDLLATEAPSARYAAFALCARYYQMVGDFVREIIREKVAMREDTLGFSDYYHFLESKKHIHPELDELSETTRAKLRQVTFRMLSEGLILEKGKEHRILVPELSDTLIRQYRGQGDYVALEHLLYKSAGS
jgi:hypothetical protein